MMPLLTIQQILPPIRRVARTLLFPSGTQYNPNLDKNRVYLIWLFQFAVFLGMASVYWRFGVSLYMAVPGLLVYVALCVWLAIPMWRNAKTPNRLPQGSILERLMKIGVWLTSLGILSIIWVICIRTGVKPILVLIFFFLLFLLAVSTFFISRYAIQNGATPWFQFSVGITLVPLLVAWVVATFVSWLNPRFWESRGTQELEQIRKSEMKKRSEWLKHAGWQKKNGAPIVVAVALSGGGYRAALIHAGLLHTLDEKCVPIRYLTTVSGGSIIGAYYALGYPPSVFQDKLVRRRPGLPDDLLAFQNLLFDWYWLSWSSADTYTLHFKNVFFGSKTIEDTGPVPRLLVNATDVEDAIHPREVFYNGHSGNHSKLNETLLAEVVAASGAFPGVFQPKVISWRSANGEPSIKERRFIDGGVVENLGIEGLSRFFDFEKSLPRPDIVIVSDASAQLNEKNLPAKVEILQLLSRSQEITYGNLHKLLYARIDDSNVQIRYTIDRVREILSGEMFKSPNNSEENGAKVASQVAGYETLSELDPSQVRKAFWVGHAVGSHFWYTTIDALRKKLGGTDSECPEAEESKSRSSWSYRASGKSS